MDKELVGIDIQEQMKEEVDNGVVEEDTGIVANFV